MKNINLLPLSEKKLIFKEYVIRGWIVFFSMTIIVSGIGVILLSPSFFLISEKEKSTEEQLALIHKNTPLLQEKETLREKLRSVDGKIKVLEKNDSVLISTLVTAVLSHKNSEVQIKGFFYEKTENRKREVIEKFVVSGIAGFRDVLVTFAQDLEKDVSFSYVELPVSGLVQSEAIPFSLEIRLETDG